ncbi:MAG: hypothetical protein ABSD29_22295 [Verrucomicrobiota bacterium]|jgi:hypothetical protein
MKTKLVTTALCVLTFWLSTANSGFASGTEDTTSIVVDAVVVRPVSFALTIVGSVLFVVSLPVAAPSHSVDKTAHALVVAPAKDTFVRPLGDFDDYMEY